jgi:predicted Zn-dependent protease with MMP-like domain
MSDPHHDLVTPEERELFDELLEQVLAELPESLIDKLDDIPLIVEDYPSDEVLDDLDIDDATYLCGLHTGIPLTERSVEHSGALPDIINIYRDGVLNLSLDDEGYIDEQTLRRQIRITVLHELGHHFGLDEDDLRKLGYA